MFDWGNASHMVKPRAAHHRPFSTTQDRPDLGGASMTSGDTAGIERPGSLRDQVAMLRNFFGLPRWGTDSKVKEAMEDQHYETEMQDYPAAFAYNLGWGNEQGTFELNGHLSEVMIAKISATASMFITRMAPLRQHNGSLTFEFSLHSFAQHLLDKVPEQSVPRTLTSTRTKGFASMERYGIAAVLEVTFMETPQGRYTYLMNLEQMRLAAVETANYMAMVRVLEHEPFRDPFPAAHGGDSSAMNAAQISALFEEETRMWGVVHKSSGGLRIARRKAEEILSKRGVTGNLEVLPQGLEVFMQDTIDRKYYIEGPRHSSSDVLDASRPHTVITSRDFSQGHGNPTHDPIFRARSIGQFVTSSDVNFDDIPVADHCTKHMDVVVYNITKDGWVRLRYADHYLYSGLWNFSDAEAPVTRAMEGGVDDNAPGIGLSYFRDMKCYTYGQLYEVSCKQGMDRAIDKLLLLPAHKRLDFIASLRVLPQNDPRKTHDPLEDKWASDQFVEMCAQAEVLDAGRIPNVATMRDVANVDTYGSLSLAPTTMSSDTFNRLNRKRRRDDQDTEGETLDQIQVRRLNPRGALTVTTAEHIRKLKEKLLAHELFERAAGTGGAGSYNWLEDAVCAPQVGFTEDQQLVILGEAKRLLDALKDQVEANPTPEEAEKVVATFRVHIARFLAPLELGVAVAQIDNASRSPLENAAFKAGDHTISVDQTVALTGRYKVDMTDEDGQIQTAVQHLKHTEGSLPLPNDTYAATLAAKHTVLFSLPTALTLPQLAAHVLDNKHELKRGRTDALAFSVYASLVHRALLDGAGAAAAGGGAAGGSGSSGAGSAAARAAARAAAAAAPAPNAVNAAFAEVDTAFATVTASSDTRKTAWEKFKQRLAREAGTLSLDSAEHMRRRALPSQVHMQYTIRAIQTALAIVHGAARPMTHEDAAVHKSALEEIHFARARAAVSTAQVHVPFFEVKKPVVAAPSLSLAPGAPVGAAAEVSAGAHSATAELHSAAWSRAFLVDLLDRASLFSGLFYQFCVENDIPVPFYLRYWWPTMTFDMATLVRMEAGRTGAAETLYQKPHLMTAANAAQKIFIMNMSVYLCTVIKRPDKIALLPNIYCRDVLGGTDTTVNDPTNQDDVESWSRQDGSAKSMFVTAGPMNRAVPATSWLSFSGEVPASLPHNKDVAALVWYPGCEGVRMHWGLRTNGKTYGPPRVRDNNDAGGNDIMCNVICMQAHENTYDPATRNMSRITQSKGHWGPRANYTGAASVMRGAARQFHIPKHSEVEMIELF